MAAPTVFSGFAGVLSFWGLGSESPDAAWAAEELARCPAEFRDAPVIMLAADECWADEVMACHSGEHLVPVGFPTPGGPVPALMLASEGFQTFIFHRCWRRHVGAAFAAAGEECVWVTAS